ncbi:MAG: TonB-dependent receptor [Methyloglobulus sp.]|nr:TonB-dependent receptor [Methyloglobulus sp.]
MLFVFAAFLCLFATNCAALNDDKDDFNYSYGTSKRFLTISAGHPIPENQSPSVTSVITSEEIDRIGVRRVYDVLEYLPGVHVTTTRAGLRSINFRGINSEGNQQVLVMINGTPIRNPNTGGKTYLWDMPVKNIDYIEIIRGPGSMLYGADATSGVINIILKNGSNLKGGDLGGFFGSDDTYEGWAQFGDKRGDWDYSISLQGGSTNGNNALIERDAATFFDQNFLTPSSLAPGKANNAREDIDVRLDIGYKNKYRIRAGFQRYGDVGNGVGAVYALDNLGRVQNNVYTLDLTAVNDITENLKLNSKYYFYGEALNTDVYFLPPGAFGGILPNGMRNITKGFPANTGIAEQFNYTGFDNHNLTIGTGLNYFWAIPDSNKVNFISTPTVLQQLPLSELRDLAPGHVLNEESHRFNYYALIQDEWNFATDWYLTAGFRYDYYSDVADGYSPRLSLVWNATPHLTAKLIYGRAFRPPSFLELSGITLNRSPLLKPEVTNTVEFQIEKEWSPSFKTSTNAYWYELDNFISSGIDRNFINFKNNPKINGVGFEAEASYRATDTISMTFNYSYHGISRTENTGLLPEHMAKGLVSWQFAKNWTIGTQLNWIGEIRRGVNDPRKNLADYFDLGVTLSTKIADPVEITLRANNLLGANARDPSGEAALLPNDIPVLDRSVLGQIKWSF